MVNKILKHLLKIVFFIAIILAEIIFFERITKMNKTDLVNIVAQEAELKKGQAEAAVNATIAAITNALKDGDKVQIIGFGTFEVKATAQREGRNPKTGEAITIDAAKRPTFSASKVLKDAVNE